MSLRPKILSLAREEARQSLKLKKLLAGHDVELERFDSGALCLLNSCMVDACLSYICASYVSFLLLFNFIDLITDFKGLLEAVHMLEVVAAFLSSRSKQSIIHRFTVS